MIPSSIFTCNNTEKLKYPGIFDKLHWIHNFFRWSCRTWLILRDHPPLFHPLANKRNFHLFISRGSHIPTEICLQGQNRNWIILEGAMIYAKNYLVSYSWLGLESRETNFRSTEISHFITHFFELRNSKVKTRLKKCTLM